MLVIKTDNLNKLLIEEDFKLDEAVLKAEMMSDDRIDDLFKQFNGTQVKQLEEVFIKDLKVLRKRMSFFEWYDYKLNRNQQQEQKYIQMLKSKENIWSTIRGEKIKSIHPPQENIQLSLSTKASPYKDASAINEKTPIKAEFFAHVIE